MMPVLTKRWMFSFKVDRFCNAFRADSFASSFPPWNILTRGSIAPSEPREALLWSVSSILESAVAIRILLMSEPAKGKLSKIWLMKYELGNRRF